jgi:hypothetical protein
MHMVATVPEMVSKRLEYSWRLFFFYNFYNRRWQRPRGLRYELSSLARTLGSWVRIPLKAQMSVYVYFVFVLFFV